MLALAGLQAEMRGEKPDAADVRKRLLATGRFAFVEPFEWDAGAHHYLFIDLVDLGSVPPPATRPAPTGHVPLPDEVPALAREFEIVFKQELESTVQGEDWIGGRLRRRFPAMRALEDRLTAVGRTDQAALEKAAIEDADPRRREASVLALGFAGSLPSVEQTLREDLRKVADAHFTKTRRGAVGSRSMQRVLIGSFLVLLMIGCTGVVGAGRGPTRASCPMQVSPPTTAAASLTVGQTRAPRGWWAPINAWRAISNTKGPNMLGDIRASPCGSNPGWSRRSAGGHASPANALDNSVMTINLEEAAPSWQRRRGPSDSTGFDPSTMAIFPSDGAPAPRHLYEDVTWSPEAGVYIIGGRFLVGGDDTRATFFAFHLTTLTWSRLADRPSDGVAYSARDTVGGRLYST